MFASVLKKQRIAQWGTNVCSEKQAFQDAVWPAIEWRPQWLLITGYSASSGIATRRMFGQETFILLSGLLESPVATNAIHIIEAATGRN